MSKESDKKLRYIKEELVMARKLNEEYLQNQMREAIDRYTGVHVPAIGLSWDIMLNEVYPIIQYNLPSIFFRDPRAFLKPKSKTFIVKRRNPVTGEMEPVTLDASKSAKTQEHILNHIIGQIGYKKECQKVLMDALLFKFGVLWHGYKGNFGMTDEQSMFIGKDQVFVQRLSPMRFFKDPAVGMADIDKGRWVARSFDVPLDDLIEDNRLDVDKQQIKGKVGYGDRLRVGLDGKSIGGMDVLRPAGKPLIDTIDPRYKQSSRCRFVEVFEVFCRPTPKEERDGHPGEVLLLTFEQDKALREPNNWPYKFKGWPSEVLEFNPLNDSQFGLADIETYKQIVDQKNAIINLQLRNAQENSKVWIAIAKGGMNEEDIEMVQKGDNTIVFFDGETVQGRMNLMSPGGTASSELYLIDQRIQKNLEDKSGVSDMKRGFLQSGEESATSVKLRAAGGSVRPAYRQDIMTDFLKSSFSKINKIDKQFFTVDEAVRIVGSLDLEWSEKPSKEEIQADVDVELDVISMLPENPEKEIQELNTVLSLMINALSNQAILEKLKTEGANGMTFELTPIIENLLMRLKIRNPDVFRAIKPEESQGMVSVSEIRGAKANVEATLSGAQEMPSPPAPGQDHLARLETYDTIVKLIEGVGETEALVRLKELMMQQSAIMEEERNIKSPTIGAPLKKPTNMLIGAGL